MLLSQLFVFLGLSASIPLSLASSHAYEPPSEEHLAAFFPIMHLLRNPHSVRSPPSSPRQRPETNPPALREREIVAAPPVAPPATPTQVSPTMTLDIGGKPVIYVQKFSSVPDQWPAPSSGSIGLGTLEGAIGQTKTIQARAAAETEGL